MKIENVTKMKGVQHLYDKKESKGIATITKFDYDAKENALFHMRNLINNGPLFHMYNGTYIRLHVNGELMMSDTAMERISNTNIVNEARGKVLIAGLGIGLIIQAMLEKEEVTEILVIEKYQDVIDLVKPKFNNPKLKIVCADIFKYIPASKYDIIYFDIWPIINTENLEEIETLENKYTPFLNENGFMDSWLKDYLILQKGIEEGTHCEDCGKPNEECECELCECCDEKLSSEGLCDFCNCSECGELTEDCTCYDE